MLLTTIAAAGLAACTTATGDDDMAPEEDMRVGERVDRICFTGGISGFRDWEGGDGLILRKGPSEEYLATLFPGCLNVDNAMRVGFDERFGGGCLRRGDDLFVSDRMFAGGAGSAFDVVRCRVDAIYVWDEDADTEPMDQ
jgi:hypothetical protein